MQTPIKTVFKAFTVMLQLRALFLRLYAAGRDKKNKSTTEEGILENVIVRKFRLSKLFHKSK
jgi:hypothetical protein